MENSLGIREYNKEDGKPVDLSKLEYHGRGEPRYAKACDLLVRGCNDIFIEYKGGILLVVRDNSPAKGHLWAIGGGIERGVPIETSLRKKVKEECNLELKDIRFLGVSRYFWNTGSSNNDKGTDDLCLVYFGRGIGNLKLDKLHKNPKIVTPSGYPSLRDSLHPGVRDFMDKVMKLVKQKS
jgi:8-oxo-dGTP pyrophosphatase MutT (NUDIX family)